ncbi:unnamed protein product [Musa textilis]
MFIPKPPTHFRGYKVHLLNPITDTMINFYPFMHFIIKGVISTSPLASDFLFAILGYHCMEKNISVFLYEQGYPSCQDLKIDDPMDIMFHHGRLYVLTGTAKIMVYAFKPHWTVSIISVPYLEKKIVILAHATVGLLSLMMTSLLYPMIPSWESNNN